MTENFPQLRQSRARHLMQHPAVSQQDQVGPEFHPEGTPQGFSFAVLNLDVPDLGVVLESSRQLRLDALA